MDQWEAVVVMHYPVMARRLHMMTFADTHGATPMTPTSAMS